MAQDSACVSECVPADEGLIVGLVKVQGLWSGYPSQYIASLQYNHSQTVSLILGPGRLG